MEKQATIRDVAALAGVSTATVSRALHDADYPMNPQLRQRVRNAADQLGYVPNLAAQSLRRASSRDIGLVLPNVSNPFYLQTLSGISDALAQSDCNLILCNTMRNVEQERLCLRQLYERQVKGVILSSLEVNAKNIRQYTEKGIKFVLLDQQFADSPSPGIHFDSRAGARMAMDYLLSMGHRQIAFATTPLNRWTRNQMYLGYRDALASRNIPWDDKMLYEDRTEQTDDSADPELQIGQHIAAAFLQDGCPATAILCVNDMVAIGVMSYLQKMGVRVPEDVSVMGFDDIPLAPIVSPALTTVRYPASDTGRLAAIMLTDMLQNPESEMTVSMGLTPQLVLRESVRRRNADQI